MTDTLGDRIRAKREHTHSGAREAAKAWAKKYIDSQLDVLKAYVDKRIAKLATDNNLIDKP